jgi:hypothetical protein
MGEKQLRVLELDPEEHVVVVGQVLQVDPALRRVLKVGGEQDLGAGGPIK